MKEEQDKLYQHCLYRGIASKIHLETLCGTEDRTEDMTYLVDRYTEEYGNPEGTADATLEQLLEEYKAAVKRREKKTDDRRGTAGESMRKRKILSGSRSAKQCRTHRGRRKRK